MLAVKRCPSRHYSADGLLVAQSIAGAESTFAWDLAVDLPQVLATSEGVKSLYGLGRIGIESGADWYYPQADAPWWPRTILFCGATRASRHAGPHDNTSTPRGSVRQWTDTDGAVAGLQGYSPTGASGQLA